MFGEELSNPTLVISVEYIEFGRVQDSRGMVCSVIGGPGTYPSVASCLNKFQSESSE